jgi:hypothetical protein
MLFIESRKLAHEIVEAPRRGKQREIRKIAALACPSRCGGAR